MDNLKDRNQYDMYSQMSLEELIRQERAALNLLKSSSDFIAKDAKNDLGLIREVMKNVHNYNWISKKVKVSL